MILIRIGTAPSREEGLLHIVIIVDVGYAKVYVLTMYDAKLVCIYDGR